MAHAQQIEAVRYEERGEIALIVMDNPPVNALGAAVRTGIVQALALAAENAGVKAAVLAGAAGTFSGGADITEFGGARREPLLVRVNAACEAFGKPLVAAISGVALGGGLELALACHARVATPDARIGLPEVKLGLLPGAGGTQRLPRLIGAKAALDVIVTGAQIGGAEAASLGIVDKLAEGDVIEAAMDYARELLSSGRAPLPVRDRTEHLAVDSADIAGFDAHAERLLRKTRGLRAPRACVQAVRMALNTPFDEALEAEQKMFVALISDPESKAQRHLFFAERQAAKVSGVSKNTPSRPISRVGVIGAGTMGGGIAMSFANAGIATTILEADDAALERGLGVIARSYDTSVGRGSITREERDVRYGRITGTTDYGDLADADLIIEAVFEDMEVKKQVFARLDAVARPGAVLASNTSYLDIDEIAQATSRPDDVVGMHFFSPANVMRLLEIVRGNKTAPDVLATALAVAKRIGKVPVVVGVCHGFVGNRMLAARGAELESLLLAGATPAEVDKAFTDFGFPMGPFAMGDLAGLDIGWRNRKALGKTAVIADALCELGRFGQKTGKGYYRYENGSRQPMVDADVTALVEAKARELGIDGRQIEAQEIIERTIYPMINEGARILDEGIAARSSDIDVVWVYGYGFPVAKGGPMYWAEQQGIDAIAERLRHWHGVTGKEIFAPAGQFAATSGRADGAA